MLSPKEASERWATATRNAARNHTAGVDPLEQAREAYIAERMTVEELEAEVGKPLAGEGR